MKKKNIVVVGGGTGTHTVLRGLRNYTDKINLAAVVSMSDSGGSTGRLRDEFGQLPIGDVRNAMTALASEGGKYESLMRQLFMYRFSRGEGLTGHNFGNLFLTALTDILGSEVEAISAASHILKIAGRVIPVTTDNTQLAVEYSDGSTIIGEKEIEEGLAIHHDSRIVSLWLTPEAHITKEAAQALKEADMIVFGPGDLYTSILANCVVKGFVEAVRESEAHIVYVCNLMSKSGQTVGMQAAEHVAEIGRHIGRAPDTALVNSTDISEDLLAKYAAEGDHPIINNCLGDICHIDARALISTEEINITPNDSVKRSLVRHDSDNLAVALMEILEKSAAS
jgi:uncharacterized cofD-like protein